MTTKVKKGRKPMYHVEAEYWQKAIIGMNQVLERLGLAMSPKKHRLFGNHCLAKKTERDYLKHIRGLRYFCCLIGDYESLLILQEDAPRPFSPAVSANTAAAFILYKRNDANAILKLPNGEKKEIKCTGKWKDPKNTMQFSSALSSLHNAWPDHIGGSYQDSCLNCVIADKACMLHERMLGRALLLRRGDPTLSQPFKDINKQSKKEGSGYLAHGDDALTVFELLVLRQNLMSSNKMEDFQLWVLVLVSIRLFLRSEEATGEEKRVVNGVEKVVPVGLTMDSFVPSLCIIRDGILESLAVKVQGKTDKHPVTLQLWRDKLNPELCPIVNLQLYSYLIGIKERANGGHTPAEKQLICLLFGVEEHFKRLCALLDIDIKTAQRYERDADAALKVSKFNRKFDHFKIEPWVPIRVESLQMVQVLNSEGSAGYRPLLEIAIYYIEEMCGVDKNDLNFSINWMFNKMSSYNNTDNLGEKFKEKIAQWVQPEIAQKILEEALLLADIKVRNALLGREMLVNDDRDRNPRPKKRRKHNNHLELANAERVQSTITIEDTEVAQSDSNKRQRASGEVDFPKRTELSKMKTSKPIIIVVKEKVEAIIEIHENGKDHGMTTLTLPCQNFMKKTVQPLIRCFENHFDSDLDKFCSHFTKLPYSRYNEKCKGYANSDCTAISNTK
ncbi:hypothetical protein HDV04_005364 [Boothiomyces sp. JEL0838]|nr:hypothetical protein HDV04_005364 [Boothiomyces sp. JEL0838]